MWLCNTPGFWGRKFLDASTHGKVTEPFPYPPSTLSTATWHYLEFGDGSFCTGSGISMVLGEGDPVELVSLSFQDRHWGSVVL